MELAGELERMELAGFWPRRFATSWQPAAAAAPSSTELLGK